MDKLCVCGPRAKDTVTGVAIAFDLLVEELTKTEIEYRIVDATRGVTVAKSGTFTMRRAWDTCCVILLVWWQLLHCKTYYATMSTSSLGFIRDYLTVGFAKSLGRRTVLHLHGGGFEDFYTNAKPWLQRLIRANIRRTDAIIVLGKLLKDQFYVAGDFVKPKLVVVPNGLPRGVEEPEKLIKQLPSQGPVELLYLSSLMPSKGFYDVLEAMRLLERKQPGGYHLNLCGSFVDAKTEIPLEVGDVASLEAYIAKHGLKDCVTFCGQVVGTAKEQQFRQAHIFLLPTSYPWEGQPLSIIEALAFSTPVISCHHRGIPELVKAEESGLFVEPKSPAAIAQAVQQLASNPEGFERMSQRAREHFELNFKREVHLELLVRAILS